MKWHCRVLTRGITWSGFHFPLSLPEERAFPVIHYHLHVHPFPALLNTWFDPISIWPPSPPKHSHCVFWNLPLSVPPLLWSKILRHPQPITAFPAPPCLRAWLVPRILCSCISFWHSLFDLLSSWTSRPGSSAGACFFSTLLPGYNSSFLLQSSCTSGFTAWLHTRSQVLIHWGLHPRSPSSSLHYPFCQSQWS